MDDLRRQLSESRTSDGTKVMSNMANNESYYQFEDDASSKINMEIDFEQEPGQKCPYCSRSNLKSVNIHIGHVHKCKVCKQLTWQCKGH